MRAGARRARGRRGAAAGDGRGRRRSGREGAGDRRRDGTRGQQGGVHHGHVPRALRRRRHRQRRRVYQAHPARNRVQGVCARATRRRAVRRERGFQQPRQRR